MSTAHSRPSDHLFALSAKQARRAFAIAVAVTAGGCTSIEPRPTALPFANRVDISARLVTAGQPSRAQLQQLSDAGFQAVVHIASASLRDGVHDEAIIVGAQAVRYVRILVDPDALTNANVRELSAALAQFQSQKVLVHCERNVLASTFVFLYRVLDLREPAGQAIADVEKAWAMRGGVRDFVKSQLHARSIDLDLSE